MVLMKVRAIFAILIVSVLTSVPARAQDPPAWVAVFDPFQLLTLNLTIAAADWDTIRRDMTFEIEVPAQF
jgi:hypothetical protein